jgi:hypothetical protein
VFKKGVLSGRESGKTLFHWRVEYVRGTAYTNAAESWVALLERGVGGVFHHVSEKPLDRYIIEFSFRWNTRKLNDGERLIHALKGVEGKRLMYKLSG